jgi:hypothetical protein
MIEDTTWLMVSLDTKAGYGLGITISHNNIFYRLYMLVGWKATLVFRLLITGLRLFSPGQN